MRLCLIELKEYGYRLKLPVLVASHLNQSNSYRLNREARPEKLHYDFLYHRNSAFPVDPPISFFSNHQIKTQKNQLRLSPPELSVWEIAYLRSNTNPIPKI